MDDEEEKTLKKNSSYRKPISYSTEFRLDINLNNFVRKLCPAGKGWGGIGRGGMGRGVKMLHTYIHTYIQTDIQTEPLTKWVLEEPSLLIIPASL